MYNFLKIRLLGAEVFLQMGRQAVMANPIVAFRDFAKASKNQNPRHVIIV